MEEKPHREAGGESEKTCPFCEKSLLPKALKCRYCGKWLPETLAKPEPSDVPEDEVGEHEVAEHDRHEPEQFPPFGAPLEADAEGAGPVPLANYRAESVVHFVVLSVSTLGLYHIWWFWRNWCYIRDETPKDINPALRTAGVFVPLVSQVLMFLQLRDVAAFADEPDGPPSYSPGLSTLAYLGIAIAGYVYANPLIQLAAVIPLIPVQQTLNKYWERTRPDAPARTWLERDDVLFILASIVIHFALLTLFTAFGVQPPATG